MAGSPLVIANLPAGLEEPGVYVQYLFGGDQGLSAPNKRGLILGYMTPGYPGRPDEPIVISSADECEVLFGPKSMLTHAYAAAKAQQPLGWEAVLLPLLEPSGGTASSVTVEFVAEPIDGVLQSNTAALSADTVYVLRRGRGVAVSFRKGDDFDTIAAAVKAAWDQLYNAPAKCTRSGAALSFDSNHKGDFDDGAMEITFASAGQSGVAAKLGTLTVSGAAGAAGTVTVRANKGALTVDVGNGDTAIATGTALRKKINSTAFAVRAAEPSTASGVVTLFYVSRRPVRPLSISSTETNITGQTVADSVGTAGAGVPTLAAALVNLSAIDEAYRAWSLFFRSANELGQVAAHVEAQAAAPIQKDQIVLFCTVQAFAAMATSNVPTATTPRLDATPRYAPLWAQCAPNAEFELSARYVAVIAAEPYVSRNWNYLELIGSSSAPIVPIHIADRPSVDERNVAISTYRHAPITTSASGNLVVTWGGNCYRAKGFKDAKLRKISAMLTLGYYRADLRLYLDGLYRGKKLKTLSEARTANAVEPSSIEASVYRWCARLDDADLFDGAEAKRDAIRAAVVVSPGRVDINVPFSPLADLDQLAVTGVVE